MGRDIRRMAELEGETAENPREQRARRLRRVERIQGEARQRSAAIEQRVTKDILANRPPITLARTR